MTFHVQVLYPNDEGAKFDLDYYVKTHMPLVVEKWSKYGLKGYNVTEYKPGPDGAKPKYSTSGTLIWDKPEDVQTAMGSGDDAAAIFGDIPNFSNVQPIILSGPIVDSK
ncbi:uncharacterized protein PV06_05966 [Exophiala oligosperma]|uniref:EthD domain-containing protein n=2 Tax=Chaetothyriales TaxID=34395 RepID=A0A0D2AR45_9EURO|nr:uncharacterized protein PV06_05966 [Exophiala oligosperma]KAJ9628136.1 hypothetical protein H2204_009538 [Knufia peltigerae]KIW42411.1 hypothetical protein PV06_05966 [Exophiala oligosperma]